MTEASYTITESEHQTLTDFLRAVHKGSLTKGRMGELAAVHLDDLTIKESEANTEVEPRTPDYPDRLVITFTENDGTTRVIAWYPKGKGPDGKSGYRPEAGDRNAYDDLAQRYEELREDIAIERHVAEEVAEVQAPEPLDNLPAGDLAIGFQEFDGTQRVIVWHQADEEQPAGYRPDTSKPDPYAVLVEAHRQLHDILAKERDTASTQYDARMNGIISELQGIAGIEAPIDVVLNRLRETQECVDALMVLPTKAGTVRALRRVLKFREGLVECQTFLIEAIKSFNTVIDFAEVHVDVEDFEEMRTQAEELELKIGYLVDPPGPEPEP